MTDSRKDRHHENGPKVGMMCSRLESDPRAEMIRNPEKDLRAGTTTNRDLVRGQGAGMTSLRNLAKDPEVETMNLLDLERDQGAETTSLPDFASDHAAETHHNLTENRITLIFGQTRSQTMRKD